MYHDLYLDRLALVERENVGLDLTKSCLCPSFFEDQLVKGVGLRVVDSNTSNQREADKVIVLPLFAMKAKDTIRIQTCELTKEELVDFLEDYPIPLEYKVMLSKRNQTIFHTPDGLNTFGCAKLTTFSMMCKAYGCEPSVELFHGFLTYSVVLVEYPQLLSKDNRYPANVRIFPDPILFMDGLKPSWEHSQQRPTIIVGGKEMAFRNFMYAKTDKDLSFLTKEPSPNFGTGSPSLSTRATHAKTASSKDLLSLTMMKDANAYHLKISSITPLAWKGHLDKHLDLELLDLQDRCYARQAVVDNAVNRRA
ncbi:hypothetical protein Tco_0099440 [Tanacetum coccineum]